jgi:hypothetical protein
MAAAAAASSKSKLDIAKTEFVKSAFAKGVIPAEQEAAVKALLKTANGQLISLADSNSAGDTVFVKDQFKVIMDTLSNATADEKLVANISLPENANISTTSSYVVPTGVTLTIGTYASGSISSRDSGTYTISCSDHLFKAEGGSIIINGGTYKVSGPNKYVIRAGINPTTRKIENALSSTVTINGGTFESDSYVMTHWGNSTTTVTGGTFKSPSSIFAGNGNAWCANAKLTINGGNFILENDETDPEDYTAVIGYWPVGYGKLTVNGGTFTINTPNRPASIFAVRAGSGVIKGGTYSITACNTSEFGKVGDAKTKLPAGMFTVTSNANYVGEPTATIDVDTSSKPANVADIVVLDSVGDTPDFNALLSGTDQSKYSSIKKYTLKDGEVKEYTESIDGEVTQA